MAKQVLIGASSGPGLAGLEVIRDLKLGNCVLADLPFDREEAVAMLRFCRRASSASSRARRARFTSMSSARAFSPRISIPTPAHGSGTTRR